MVVHALPLLYESDLADSGFVSELLVILPTYAVLGGLIAVSKRSPCGCARSRW